MPTSKEQEILNRQRALAANRRKQAAASAAAAAAASTRKTPSLSNQVRSRPKSISELLAPSSSVSRSTRSTKSSSYGNSHSNSVTSSSIATAAASSNNNNNNNSSRRPAKRKLSDTKQVIDLTSSSSTSTSTSSRPSKSKAPSPSRPRLTSASVSSVSSTLPSKPTLKRPSTKRPTKRKPVSSTTSTISSNNGNNNGNNTSHNNNKNSNTSIRSALASLRPSHSTVEKTILASRSRILDGGSGAGSGTSSTASASTTSASANSNNHKKGLSSLLSQAGITKQQLQKCSKKSKNRKFRKNGNFNNYGDDNNDDDDDDDDDELNTMNMETYFDSIREWDFLSALNTERLPKKNTKKNNNSNNNHATDDDDDDDNKEPIPIPDKFVSRKQYQNLWTPLCLNETKAQILSDALGDVSQWSSNNGNGNNGGNNNNQNGGNRQNKGKQFVSLVPVLASPHSKDVGSTKRNMTIIIQKDSSSGGMAGPKFMSNDLVVFAKAKSIFLQASKGKLFDGNGDDSGISYVNGNTAKGKRTNIKKIKGCVGIVEYGRKTVEGLPVTVSRKFWLQLSTGKKEESLVLLKLGCNVTNMREFSALCRIKDLPLLPYLLCKKMTKAKDSLDKLSELLSSTTSALVSASSGVINNDSSSSSSSKRGLIKSMGGTAELGKGFAKYATEKFNPSQLGAISAAATEYGGGGFTLIKGPPGTGKTTTLVALLNALHIRQMNKYYDTVKKIVNVNNAKSTGAKRVALEEAKKGMPRLLVCAPSNNAIDNVIRKIMIDGFIDGHGNKYNPPIVRIGSGQSDTVKEVSLETKLQSLMNEANDLPKIQSIIAGFKSELNRIQSGIGQLKRRQLAIAHASIWPLSEGWEIRCDESFDETNRVYFVNHKEKSTTFECPPPPEPGEKHVPATSMPEYRTATQQLVKLVHKFTSIKGKLDRYSLLQKVSNISGASGKGQKSFDAVKQQLETDILDSTHIVLTTLGTSGCRALEAAAKFEVVVVDEAAQSVEPATLVALQLGSSHAILVGDPQQLPATIFSVSGRNTKYDRSLFQRLEEAGHAVHLLDTQYRMHPEISEFPRKIFYGGYLKDGPNVKSAEYGGVLRMVLKSKIPSLRPFSIFDVDSAEERGGTSLANSTEANFALHLYRSLAKEAGHIATQSRVCIITPYSQQAALLRRTFSQGLGHEYTSRVEVNTVDSFQGREANIIIFSCVRAAGSRGIGFLSDVRRMNVALTRAKHFLFVIARCQSIVVNPYWDQLVKHAREGRAIIPVPMQGRFQFPELSSLEAMKPIPKEMIPVSKKRKASSSIQEGNDSDDEDGEICI